MAISDAEFLRWLKLPNARREVLYEQDFAYESGGAPAVDLLRTPRRALAAVGGGADDPW